MRDFDPIRIAGEWHSGQGSALYAYASTGRIPTEEFKDRLVNDIERSMAHADDEGLDELEYLLMSVEEQEPERSMFEGDGMCSECGGMKTEGTCECTMKEADACNECGMTECQCEMAEGVLDAVKGMFSKKQPAEAPAAAPKKNAPTGGTMAQAKVSGPIKAFHQSLKQAQKSLGDLAQEVSDPKAMDQLEWLLKATKQILAAMDRMPELTKDAWAGVRESKDSERTLRDAVSEIVKEMKLGVAGRGHFDFGGAEEMDADDVAHMLLTKKPEEKAPEAPKSGVRSKAKAKRKSKKTA